MFRQDEVRLGKAVMSRFVEVRRGQTGRVNARTGKAGKSLKQKMEELNDNKIYMETRKSCFGSIS